MACLYTHNGKTYSKEELIDYLKNNPNIYNVKPDFSNIDEIISTIPSTEKKELSNPVVKRLNKLLKEQADKLKARILLFESAKERKGYLPKEDTINKLKDLREQLSTLENTEAFFKTADFMHHELSVTQEFLDKKFDINNPDHINFLLQISNQLDSYKELATFIPQMTGLNDDIKKTGDEINLMYANINDEINEILESYMVNFVKTNSKRELSEEDILNMLKEAKDISVQELKMGGMSNSVSPLLQLLQKQVEKTREEVYENTNSWITKINNAGAKLKKAGVEGFDWMFQKTKDGKLTGRLLQKVSQAYYDAEKKVYELLEDSEGNKREYVYKPGEELSQAEKDHNIALSKDKAKLSAFLNAETSGEQGLQDGENRKYTDEFKQARSEYEIYAKDEDGYAKWIKKPFVPGSKLDTGELITAEMHDRLYKKFRRKYYQDERESFRMKKVKKGGIYVATGEVERVLVTYVKSEYTEVITEINGKPTKFGNPEYYKIINDNSAQGLAKKEYFEFYKKANDEGGVLSENFTNNFIQKAKGIAPQTEAGRLLAGDNPTTKLVQKLDSLQNRKLTLDEAQEIDEFFGDVVDGLTENGFVNKQGKKILGLQSDFRNMIDNATERDLVGGKAGFEALNQGRKLWSQAAKMRDIEKIISRAEMTDNPATALKTGFRNLYHNPNRIRGFSKEERKLIAKAADSGVATDILRTMGSRLIPIVSMGSGGGLGSAAAGQAMTMASRSAATKLQLNRAAELANKVAGNKISNPKYSYLFPTISALQTSKGSQGVAIPSLISEANANEATNLTDKEAEELLRNDNLTPDQIKMLMKRQNKIYPNSYTKEEMEQLPAKIQKRFFNK